MLNNRAGYSEKFAFTLKSVHLFSVQWNRGSILFSLLQHSTIRNNRTKLEHFVDPHHRLYKNGDSISILVPKTGWKITEWIGEKKRKNYSSSKSQESTLA